MARRGKKEEPGEIKNPTGSNLDAALDFVSRRLEASQGLEDQPPDNDDWDKWYRATLSGIGVHFGEGSEELVWCVPKLRAVVFGASVSRDLRDKRRADDYRKRLSDVRRGLTAIQEKYAALGTLPTLVKESGERVRAFISHGGMKPSLEAIEHFLRSMEIEPIVVERQASEARELNQNIDEHRSDCDFAIVIWTKDIEAKDGSWLPSGSVAIEVGELREQFGKRLIFLKETGVTLAAMGGTIAYKEFSEENLGPAFQKITTELTAWGWLKVAPHDTQ